MSGDESDVPQITTAENWHVGFGPGPKDDPADNPRHKSDYCLNIGVTWPGLVALEIKNTYRPSRSDPSTCSGKERPNGPAWSEHRSQLPRQLGRRVLGRDRLTSS